MAQTSLKGFVIYQLPNTSKVEAYSGQYTLIDPSVYKPSSCPDGFIAAPFLPNELLLFLEFEEQIKPGEKEIYKNNQRIYTASKSDYTSIVNKAVESMLRGEMKKVVLSRAEEVPLPESFDIYYFFKKLCDEYPSCFISLLSLEELGTWIGASPEVLFELQSDSLKTMALAGTRSAGSSEDWGRKEIEEQEWVSIYIRSLLEKNNILYEERAGAKSFQMGSIEHLASIFEITDPDPAKCLDRILMQFAPTPAVCGYPKDIALDFIMQNEGYERGFYSGFLGPVNHQGSTNLFVNLRCMQVLNEKAILYAGAGITQYSNAEMEWEETIRKMELLNGVMNKE